MCHSINKKKKEIAASIRGTRIIARHPSGISSNLDAGDYYRLAARGDKNARTLTCYVQ